MEDAHMTKQDLFKSAKYYLQVEEDLDRAFGCYQKLLVHHRDALTKEEVVESFFRLGEIKIILKEPGKAINLFEKAHEIDPGHQPTIRRLIKLYEERGKKKKVDKYQKMLEQ